MTEEENAILLEAVAEFGPGQWKLVSERLPNRDWKYLKTQWIKIAPAEVRYYTPRIMSTQNFIHRGSHTR